MDLKGLLREELVFFSNLDNKRDNLMALINLLKEKEFVKEADTLTEAIFSREGLMSTGIGLGIAVPHVRIAGVDDMIIAIGINKNGIKDYDSLDGEPVRLIIMIIANEEQHREYLVLLSNIVKILKKKLVIKQILNSKTSDEVVGLISENINDNH